MAKPQVAFFDFACCEGCQLQVVNLEEHILGVVNLVDVVEFREAITGKADKYDIAFIEGSITRPQDEEKIKDIRARSGLIVAFGSCACTGGINKLKNVYSDMNKVREVVYGDDAQMEHLDTYPTKAIDEVVQVDLKIPGCPVNRNELVRIIKEVAVGKIPVLPNYPVCVECKLNETVCMYDLGQTCIGPIARAGCEAPCPANGVACEGCRVTVDDPNKNAMHEILKKYDLTVDQVVQKINMYAIDPEIK